MTEEAAAPKKLDALKPASMELAMQDHKIDMFSMRGFALAQRIASAYSTSDSVPACYQAQIAKKEKGVIVAWVENPAALGNCLVAIETAQAIGMSITAVMQNTNMIEGRQSWSGQFKIGAANSARRFTPLRFDLKYPGKIKASYKEKDGWNKEKNKWNMVEHTVELDNIVCIAWCLPYGMAFPHGVTTLDQAKAAGLPVIEGPPVSMKLAVEEGWYAKPGSKWQTEMKHKMLTTRAGAWFSDIHAPDIVMGMGRTTEELVDMADTIDVQQQANGQYAATNLDELRSKPGAASAEADRHPNAETVEVRERQQDDAAPAETVQPKAETAAAETVTEGAKSETARPEYDKMRAQIEAAKNVDELADAADLMKDVPDATLRDELAALYRTRHAELSEPAAPVRRQKRSASTPAPD